MTNYERICKDKAYWAAVISSELHNGEYEDNDFDPAVMKFLDAEQREASDERAQEVNHECD